MDVLRWALVAVALVAAGYHVLHLRQPGRQFDVDVVHTAMGVAMAAMLAVGLGTGPTRGCLAVFAAATAWFAVRAVITYIDAGGRGAALIAGRARQSLCCGVMTGMLAVSLLGSVGHGAGMAMPGMGNATATPTDPRVLTAALLTVGVAVVLWTVAAVLRDRRAHTGSQLATSVGAVAMLAMLL